MRPRRPLHLITSFATMAHHGFELGAGTGLIMQPELGLAGSAAFWGVTLPAWSVAAARGSDRWDRPLAIVAGLGLGGAVVHFTLWPSTWRFGLPLLREAEGLTPGHLPPYNAILYVWGLAAAAALAKETPPAARRWAMVGFATAFAVRPNVRRHFDWLQHQARNHPAWWNRALADR
jgi:hypothetical protein